jgi:hypothetical protein
MVSPAAVILTSPVKSKVVPVSALARTAAPVPLTALICVPFTLSTFPAPAVSNVLLVRVSVVALPTIVSVDVGRVSVPVFEIDEIFGAVSVLLVSVCVPD